MFGCFVLFCFCSQTVLIWETIKHGERAGWSSRIAPYLKQIHRFSLWALEVFSECKPEIVFLPANSHTMKYTSACLVHLLRIPCIPKITSIHQGLTKNIILQWIPEYGLRLSILERNYGNSSILFKTLSIRRKPTLGARKEISFSLPLRCCLKRGFPITSSLLLLSLAS